MARNDWSSNTNLPDHDKLQESIIVGAFFSSHGLSSSSLETLLSTRNYCRRVISSLLYWTPTCISGNIKSSASHNNGRYFCRDVQLNNDSSVSCHPLSRGNCQDRQAEVAKENKVVSRSCLVYYRGRFELSGKWQVPRHIHQGCDSLKACMILVE